MVLTNGYVMCLVYKIAVIAVMGYVWEEFGVLFIFVSCARLVMTTLSVKFCNLYGGPTILQLLPTIDTHILYFSTSR